MLPDLSKSSGCIVYFFCLKLEVLKLKIEEELKIKEVGYFQQS